MRLPLTALVLLSLFGAAAGAQEPSPEPAQAAAEDLVRDTLGADIDTAGYYELIAWCRELGLADTGSSQDLRQRLYTHFHLEPKAGGEKKPAKRILEIMSARSTEYFTIEPIDENNVLLQGDVLVELREQDVVHRIKAQKVLLNQSANLLTAEGGLEYTFRRGEQEEVFRGERITFDVESWEGVFFSGGMEGDRDVGGKKVRFRFEADSIAKLRGNAVVLDRGIITSCDLPTDPHYYIKARKIWVLAPGEWAIASAVLHIGRVPVLYLPFFFRPGDEFFFHPAIGSRDREGNFLQTTTYLLGQKTRSPSALSVLAATEEQGQQYRREIRGLFLRQPEGEQVPVTENRFLKVFLDFYSRLGGFAGVSGDFPPKVSFRSGLGLSRNIYLTSAGYYTPLDGSFNSNWNKAWLFGMQIPFRYGLDGKWNVGGTQAKLSGKFEYYSDPFFARDFYNRSEEIALARFLGMESTQTTTTTEGEKRGLSWELTSQYDFRTAGLGPYLKKLSVPYLNANLYWQSKLPSPVPKDLADPTAYFYYPVSLKLPSAALQVSGELVSLPAVGASAAPTAPRADVRAAPRDLRLPGSTGAGEPARPAAESREEPFELRRPSAREKLADLTTPVPLAFTLSYQARPTMAVEQSFNSEAWLTPEEVKYDLDYASLDSSGGGSLDWVLKAYESLFTLNGSLGLSGSYRTKFRISYPEDASWENLVLNDYRYSQMQVKNQVGFTLSPFYDDPRFRATKLSYSANWLLAKYTLDKEVYGAPVYAWQPGWDKKSVSQHQAEAVFGWQPGQHLNSLSLSAQLPPLTASLTAKVDASVWLLRTSITSVFRETENTGNLTVQETFQPATNFRLSEELQANLLPWQERSWTRSVTSLTWGGFSSAFTAQQLSGGALEPASVSAAYKLAQTGWYFWKNRSKLETTINSSWSMNLYPTTIGSIDIYDNNLTFSFTLKYFLYKFLEISITTSSYNNRTYRYFPGLATEWLNPLNDLLKSFNFFDIQDRRDSSFKLKSIVVDMVHHLHDWDLTLRYDGKPKLENVAGIAKYIWSDSFSILVQWIPIPEIRSKVTQDENGFYIRD
jgi:hypothetical protein